jgi:hypothetical protein
VRPSSLQRMSIAIQLSVWYSFLNYRHLRGEPGSLTGTGRAAKNAVGKRDALMTSSPAVNNATTSKIHVPTLIKSAIVGGLILFVWQFISWSFIPWRSSLMHPFSDEGVVASTITSNAPAPGMYILPLARDMSGGSAQDKAAAEKRAAEGPIVFAAVRLGPVRPFAFGLTAQFLTQVVNALLLTLVLFKTNIPSYGGRILFIAMLALLAGVAGHVPNWNWFNFSAGYTALEMTDLLVGWTLAGLAIAKFVR